MDYDPERALWVPRWGRRGFLSLGLGALAALALPVPSERWAVRYVTGYIGKYEAMWSSWVRTDTLWIAA